MDVEGYLNPNAVHQGQASRHSSLKGATCSQESISNQSQIWGKSSEKASEWIRNGCISDVLVH